MLEAAELKKKQCMKQQSSRRKQCLKYFQKWTIMQLRIKSGTTWKIGKGKFQRKQNLIIWRLTEERSFWYVILYQKCSSVYWFGGSHMSRIECDTLFVTLYSSTRIECEYIECICWILFYRPWPDMTVWSWTYNSGVYCVYCCVFISGSCRRFDPTDEL